MRLQAIWRYPVKSMAGEELTRARLTPEGVEGDRVVQVLGPRAFVTSRTRPRLLGLKGTIAADGRALVDGHPWDGEGAEALVRAAAGDGTRLIAHPGPERFDILPLLVATDGAVAALGEDVRRLRPNLVIEGVEGLAERDWPGGLLRVGEALVGVDSLRGRCIMTTFHPDTLAQDTNVLRRINRELGGELALNCWVEQPGEVAVGDPVELLGQVASRSA